MRRPLPLRPFSRCRSRYHAAESAERSRSRDEQLRSPNTPSRWQITSLKPSVFTRIEFGADSVLTVQPLPRVPGYAFPRKLTAEIGSAAEAVWFTLELDLEFDQGDWPELIEERRRPRPDSVRDPTGNVIGWVPTRVGEDIKIPLRRTLLPDVIAAGTIPSDRPLFSELGRHQAAVRPQINLGRRSRWTQATRVEIARTYMDALADPNLNEAKRRDYVRDMHGFGRSDTTIRRLIDEIKKAGMIRQPHYQLPVDTSRVRYWIPEHSDVRQLGFGADPRITVEAGDSYETTNWETIRHIAAHKALEYEILERNRKPQPSSPNHETP
jgi:hypothetical protein